MTEIGASLKRNGERLGLVPTMGYLHEGHLSLLRLLDGKCDIKSASVFVNPIQFGKGEDIERYPRDEARDVERLVQSGCNLVFCPDATSMYPRGYQTYVDVTGLSEPLCGKYRPGHFRGVATVVLRLFQITHCSTAAFGLKDYQQALVIRQMVRDLNLDVELVFGSTIREPDGLAMSSRNAYLSKEERIAAQAIPRALKWAESHADKGNKTPVEIRNGINEILMSEPLLKPQYVEIVDVDTLMPVSGEIRRVLVAVAVYAGSTRLIDNQVIGPESECNLLKKA